MQIQLRVANGSQQGKLIQVKHEKFLIGRSDDCHLRPKSESISRRHCAIVHKNGKVLLLDLKSRNGTELNGKKLDPSRAKILKDSDHIKIGKLEFDVVMEAGVKSAKKPEVKDVKDAAARSAAAMSDSKYEEVDVSSWLDEPNQSESTTETITRQFELPDSESTELSGETMLEDHAENETQAEVTPERKKNKPGKLPPIPKKPATGSSKDAAQETLRKFFGGGR